jgi:hypothetical protein
MIRSNPSGAGVTGWPRGARLALFTVVLVLAILFMGAWAGGSYFVIATWCARPEVQSLSACSNNGQASLVLSCFAPVGLAVALGGRCLARVLGLNTPSTLSDEERPQKEPLSSWPEAAELPFGQSLISGRAESVDAGRRRLTVGSLTLRFWGGQALRNGLIRNGDQASFVYQRIALFGLNYVLAFWKGGGSPIRSVGEMIHGTFLAIALIGGIVIRALPGHNPAWLWPLCVILFSISTAYLVLLIAGKKALRDAASIPD